MDDDNPQPDTAASERQPGPFFTPLDGWLTPDPGSSDPRKLGKGVDRCRRLFGHRCGGGVYWSSTPSILMCARMPRYAAATAQDVVTGTTTVATLQETIRILLEKPGGYLHNDLFPPGVWLDNMPNWEYGVLVQSRDLARALRGAQSLAVPVERGCRSHPRRTPH
ncbi:MAG: hypothetical protein CM15mP103_11860 [Gammaproteobacteria bacterium]|nr:MAG: hypothetical protein CM15mP103_11860 [Gammaproteobacteria bacterium]